MHETIDEFRGITAKDYRLMSAAVGVRFFGSVGCGDSDVSGGVRFFGSVGCGDSDVSVCGVRFFGSVGCGD
jgi:hypothetical protein